MRLISPLIESTILNVHMSHVNTEIPDNEWNDLMEKWKKFAEQPPEESGTYDVVVAHDKGSHVETAEYSKSRNAFMWYSRRGYPYEIEVTHWRELPPLPIMENDNDTASS